MSAPLPVSDPDEVVGPSEEDTKKYLARFREAAAKLGVPPVAVDVLVSHALGFAKNERISQADLARQRKRGMPGRQIPFAGGRV